MLNDKEILEELKRSNKTFFTTRRNNGTVNSYSVKNNKLVRRFKVDRLANNWNVKEYSIELETFKIIK